MKKRTNILLAIGTLLIAALAFWLWPRPLTVTNYEVAAAVSEKIRIVQLTDLHGRQFGTDDEKLVSLISEQKPDLIFMTGDMINADEENLSDICSLVSSLSKIAPLYYSYGNHETEWISTFGDNLIEPLTQAGAKVLDLEYDDITVNGQELRVGGYYGYYQTPHMETQDKDEQSAKFAFAREFESSDRQKLLLAHIATSWVDWQRINEHEVGIVFCGHYHGGQIRIPVIDKGLYAPYVGWFPEYTKGVFYGDCATCVLSTGLGSTPGIPRIYNPPEIVVADLVPIQ